MKIKLQTSNQRQQQGGWALLLTIAMATAGMITLGGVMAWSMQNSTLAARNNEYFTTAYAAESATEKVRAAMTQDFNNYGLALVTQNMTNYVTLVPNATDSSYWTNYSFSGGTTANRVIVTNTASSSTIVLGPPFTSLSMLGSTYEIIANAQNRYSMYQISTTVGQTLNVGTIPLFQFAIFYQNDMEINPGATMNVGGPVHGNAQIYAGVGGGALTFSNDVGAVNNINQTQSPLDPTSRSAANVTFDAYHLSDQSSLTLPVGTNMSGTATNVAANVYAVLQIPNATEGPGTSIGTNMLFNNADLVVLVSNNTTTVKTGPGVASPNVVIPSNTWSQFISTNGFYDQRQAMQMDAVMLNVSNMNNWVGTNSTLYSQLGNRTLQSVYIADLRSTNSTSQPAVYLTNGAILPPTGLSIVTPDPAYVVGNWNIKTNATGSSDAGLNSTAYTYPSAIYADAVTVLSSSWNPANSTANISSRAASSDTVNAAVLTGNVPSNNSYYSGGVENFLRFLEDWSNDTLTYNGSLVCMFPSQISTGAWPGTGTVYNPPTRNWSFDLNFNNPTKLPPLTPRASAVVRGKWATLPPQTTSF